MQENMAETIRTLEELLVVLKKRKYADAAGPFRAMRDFCKTKLEKTKDFDEGERLACVIRYLNVRESAISVRDVLDEYGEDISMMHFD